MTEQLTFGKSTKITSALALALAAAGVSAVLLLKDVEANLRQEVREGKLEAAVRFARFDVKLDNIEQKVGSVEQSHLRSEGRFDSEVKEIKKRLRALELDQGNRNR